MFGAIPDGEPRARRRRSRWNLVGTVCTVLGVLLLVGIGTFERILLDDGVADRAGAERVRSATMRHLFEFNKKLQADGNGYRLLADTLGTDKEPGARWAPALALLDKGSRQGTLDALRQDPALTARSLREFLVLEPRLREAISMKIFAYPVSVAVFGSRVNEARPNYIGMRSAVHGLRVAGLMSQEQGRPDEAVRTHLTALQLGQHMMDGGDLLDLMVGAALQDLSTEGITWLLESPDLTPATCRRIVQALSSQPPAGQRYLNAMDTEYTLLWLAMEAVKLPAGGEAADDPGFRRSALVEREKSVYTNWYMAVRPSLQRLRNPALDGHSRDEFDRMMRFSTMAIVVTPPQDFRSLSVFKLSFDRRSAVLALAALQCHRLERGSYPDRLEDLTPTYLKALPSLPGGGATLRYARQGDTFTLDLVSDEYKHARLRDAVFRIHPSQEIPP